MDYFDFFSFVSITILTLLLLYIYGTWTYSTWTTAEVCGPKPIPIFGNALEIRRKGNFAALRDWGIKYGKTYGVYIMRTPLLLTTDVDLIKEVFVKDFTNFAHRGFVSYLDPYPLNLGLAYSNGDQWRRQRHAMTPTFSTKKLRMMEDHILQCCQKLESVIIGNAQNHKQLDVKKVFGAYTLDVIAGTAFGLETKSLGEVDKNNIFLETAKLIRVGNNHFVANNLLAFLFPSAIPLLRALRLYTNNEDHVSLFKQAVQSMIDSRKRERDQHRVDFLQLMLDSESKPNQPADPDDKLLSTDEVLGQSIILFIAGYETTSGALQYLTYMLALHPDKQEKLYEEIIHAIGNDKPTYDSVMGISYLSSCVHEALRLFPPSGMVTRVAVKERTLNGIKIPAGCNVALSIYGMSHDPTVFPEPDKFIPERFEDGNQSMSTILKELAFSVGPRQCIGMRLALFEINMAMAFIVRKFKFVKIPQTPEPITFKRFSLSQPNETIYVGVRLRKA